MQRLFSTFANGWPGRGLLILRIVTFTILFRSAIALTGQAPLASSAAQIIGAGAGTLLLLGLWTPMAGTIVAIAELAVLISDRSDPWIFIMLATAGASLAMIGPGARSIDARLFGRKQIDMRGSPNPKVGGKSSRI